jgi:hypothetical protein
MIILHTPTDTLILFIGKDRCLTPIVKYRSFSSSRDVDYFKNHVNNLTIGPNELMEWLE